jgi:hypothetical protein
VNVGHAALDTCTGIFFSKDRREEVIEIEEEPVIYQPTGANESVKLLTQGQWMKGCPEKGEQSFLFSLYSQIGEPEFACPHECGAVMQRSPSHFFALYVSQNTRFVSSTMADTGTIARFRYVRRSPAGGCARTMPKVSLRGLPCLPRAHIEGQ